MSKVYIVLGVSASGKTTIGKLLADKLDLSYYDADDFHSQENIDKMRSGRSLNDEDRQPWLEAMALKIKVWTKGQGAVLGCSALKERYRKTLMDGCEAHVEWIYLKGSYELLAKRSRERKGHYFKEKLLQSQFDTLEPPTYGIHVSVVPPPEKIVENILKGIRRIQSKA